MNDLKKFFLSALVSPDGDMSAKRLVAVFLIVNAVVRSYIPGMDAVITGIMLSGGIGLLGAAALTHS